MSLTFHLPYFAQNDGITDFSTIDPVTLNHQLQNYIIDLRSSDGFLKLKGIGDIARKLMETNEDIVYPLIYLLLNLVTYIEKDVFSSVNHKAIMQRFQP